MKKKKPFKCDICDYSFSLKSGMILHVASVHEENKEKMPFKCEVCNYCCSTKQQIKRHVASVHEEEQQN